MTRRRTLVTGGTRGIGAAIKVKAKITVEQPSGKLLTKSLKTSFAVC